MRSRIFLTLFIITFVIFGYSQTPFTYQGQLLSGGAPINSTVAAIFKLYDAPTGGSQIGFTIMQNFTPVNGLFTVSLDFGPSAFPGSGNVYLEITINAITLTPRQPITPAPYAYSLVLPFVGSTTNGDAISVTTTHGTNAIFGESDASAGNGVTGYAPNFNGIGVYGYALHYTGTGVVGYHYSNQGTTPGVEGVSLSTANYAAGVYGLISSTSPGFNSAGVYGENDGSGLSGCGVYGSHASSGIGVYGIAPSGDGVKAESTSGIGLYATSTSGYGSYSFCPNGTGAYGGSTSSNGVNGVSVNGNGVYAIHSSSTGASPAVFAITNSSDANALAIQGNCLNGNAIFGTSTNGIGVYGNHVNTTGTSPGVQGSTASNDGNAAGVYGLVSSTSPGAFSAAVRGENKGTTGSGIGIYGSHAGGGWGVYGTSVTGDGVFGTTSGTNNAYGVYASGTGNAAFLGGAMGIVGNFQMGNGAFKASPTTTQWTTNKPATVKLNDGTQVKLFAEEAAEIYFNDYGIGQLQNGRAHIALDKKFAQTVTVDEAHPMMVFIQLEGDSDGVFVTNKTISGFDVIERHNGNSSCNFSYRIVCKRKHYEDERLATQDEDIMFNTRMLNLVWPEQMEQAKLASQQNRQNANPK